MQYALSPVQETLLHRMVRHHARLDRMLECYTRPDRICAIMQETLLNRILSRYG